MFFEYYERGVNMKKADRITLSGLLTIVYVVILIWIILFKMSSLGEIGELDQIRSINLIPFHYDTEVNSHFDEVVWNIIIFIPLGVYLKLLKKGTSFSILFGAGLSLLFEMLQYLIGIGATDITDFITNTSGTIIGVGIYLVLSLFFRQQEKLDKILNILALAGTLLFGAFVILIFAFN